MGLFDNIGQIDCPSLACDDPLGAASEMLRDCPANITRAEVNTLILQHPTVGVPILNWPASGETGLVALDIIIDNTDATDVAKKLFVGSGSVDAPEESTAPLNDGQVHVLDRKYTLVFNMWDITAVTYDYLRQIQCGKAKPKFYFADRGNYLYGIEDGLNPSSWTVHFPKATGDDALNTAVLTITWSSKVDPDRVIYPL